MGESPHTNSSELFGSHEAPWASCRVSGIAPMQNIQTNVDPGSK